MSYVYVKFPYIPTLNDMWEIPTSPSPQKCKFKHIIFFNRQLFWGIGNLVLSAGDPETIKASACSTDAWDVWGAKWLLLFLLFCGPCQRGGAIIEGYLKISTPATLGWALSEHSGTCTRLIIWHHILHFGHLAHGCWQTYWLWWGTNLWPLFMWDDVQYQPCRSCIWINLSVVIGGLSLNDEGRT